MTTTLLIVIAVIAFIALVMWLMPRRPSAEEQRRHRASVLQARLDGLNRLQIGDLFAWLADGTPEQQDSLKAVLDELEKPPDADDQMPGDERL